MKRDQIQLYGAVAAAVLLAGGGGFAIARFMDRPASPAAEHAEGEEEHAEGGEHAEDGERAESEEGHDEGEEGHAGAAVEEGVVALTSAQVRASGIAVVGVTRGGGAETLLSGRVEPMVDARALVGAAVAGRVERVLVAPGQSVRAGQPLAVLVSGDAATYRADADAAAAAADAARRAYQRDQSLAAQGVVARQDAETARAQALSAEANARAARARVTATGSPNSAGRFNVTSPIPGVVSAVQVGPGGFLAQGGVVAEVTNPARMELVFNAAPALAAGVRVGSAVQVAGPGGEFEALVTGVAAGANAQTGGTVIRARASTTALPPAGSAVTGSVRTGGTGGGLTVPSEAVQTLEGRSVVFVMTPKGFRATPVLIGRQGGGRTEILRGLTGAERIASANAFLLKAEMAKGEAEHGH
jgi:cobalt-zinc-cadmium efflux system membrane fusion protein